MALKRVVVRSHATSVAPLQPFLSWPRSAHLSLRAMPQVQRQEDPIEGASFSGFYRSCFVQMEVYRDRPAPTCAFLLSLAYWGAAICRICWPQLVDPRAASACLLPEAVFAPTAGEWRRYLLHGLWPVEPTYLRSFLVSVVLLLQGYTLEYEVGSFSFLGFLLAAHVVSAFVLLRFQFVACHVSLETALIALAVIMHRVNPKIHSDGLDPSLRVSFTVEPRWHMWIFQALLLLLAADFPATLVSHAVGLAIGLLLTLRDPESWQDIWHALQRGSPTIGYALHVVVFLFSITFMPTTMANLPADFLAAVVDGRAFSIGWWQASVLASQPLLHMALIGQVAPEALFLMKLLIALALPWLLSPFHTWLRGYAGGCVILMMYAMTSSVWRYPHVGFLALAYLVWAFWNLRGMRATKDD